MAQMMEIRRFCESFLDGANEGNQKITSVIYRWFKRNKPEDYISHLERVQMK